jgi:Polysaccharide lyase
MPSYASARRLAPRLLVVTALLAPGPLLGDAARTAHAAADGAERGRPAVRWAAPRRGETVAGVLAGSRCAVTTVRGRVRQVAFFVDGRRQWTDKREPYRCRIDTTKLHDGWHRLKAVVPDRRGKHRSTAASVTVPNPGYDKTGKGSVRSVSINVDNEGTGVDPGAVTFRSGFDDANVSEWNDVQCTPGRLSFGSTAPTPFQGTHRARFEVRRGDVEPVTGLNRCDLDGHAEPTMFQEGEDVFYRFQVRLQSPWPFEGKWNALWQLHQWATPGSPQVIVQVEGSSAATGRLTVHNARELYNWWNGPTPLALDTWHDFVIRVKHSANPAVGFVEVWRNGVRQTMVGGGTRKFGKTMPAGATYNYAKFGYYRDPTHVGTGVLFGDGYVTGTSYAAVAGAY